MRLLLAIFLFISTATSGQFLLINQTQGSQSSVTYPSDFGINSSPGGIWSVRKVVASYSGDAMIIRRSTDDATLAIGYTSQGDLDVSAVSTFIGAGDAFVQTLYDQSGNGKTMQQLTIANQPQLQFNITGTKPSMYFDGVNDVLMTAVATANFYTYLHNGVGSYSVIGQAGMSVSPEVAYGFVGNYASTRGGFGVYISDASALEGAANFRGNFATNTPAYGISQDYTAAMNQFHSLVGLVDASNATLGSRIYGYVDNLSLDVVNSVGVSPVIGDATYSLQIGTLGNNSSYLNGYVSEVIIEANRNWSSTERNDLYYNQEDYFQLYDTDALNYVTEIAATGVTPTDEEKIELNMYFKGLKGFEIWNLLYDRVPMFWANASANFISMKGVAPAPTIVGTLNHTSSGVSASTSPLSYVDLNFTPASALTLNNTHVSLYITQGMTVAGRSEFDIGSRTSNPISMAMATKYNASYYYESYNTSSNLGRLTGTATGSETGYFVMNRTSSSDFKVWRNMALLASTTNSGGTDLPTHNFYLFAMNNIGSVSVTSTKTISMWSAGLSFPNAELTADHALTERLMDLRGIGQ